MPVNVAFYSDALTTGCRYGLGRYAWELFRELHKMAPQATVRPVSAHVGISSAELAALKLRYGHVRLPGGRKLMNTLWSALGAPPLEVWAPWADIVHSVE